MANKRRGQAALEFLTTYGWAFMIILVMIGALAYFGVLNPRNLIPDSCSVQAGFTCGDYMIDATGGTINLILVNNLGRAVDVSDVEFTNAGITAGTCAFAPNMAIADGARFTAACTNSTTLVAGEKMKLGFSFTYQNSVGGDFDHVVSGTVTATAQ